MCADDLEIMTACGAGFGLDTEKEFPFMRRSIFVLAPFAAAFVSVSLLIGCGGPKEEKAPSGEQEPTQGEQEKTTKTDGPAAAVHKFLEAARTGNDKAATAMLTKLARQSLEKLGRSMSPRASDTARFEIAEVQMVAEDGARVCCVWTDLDENNQEKSYEMVWMARKEEEGWRIAGMATEVFENEPPLVLNFENPEELLEKEKMLGEEIRRRQAAQAAPQGRTAQQPAVPGNQPIRR